jgi:hypothetical protein
MSRPNSVIVGAVNGALESLAKGLALELAPVRVVAVPFSVGAPLASAPPCIQHLRCPQTGADLHGAPDRVWLWRHNPHWSTVKCSRAALARVTSAIEYRIRGHGCGVVILNASEQHITAK